MAGLTQAPSAYDPFADPVRARARRDVVLRAMLVNGAITPDQYGWAVNRRALGLRAGHLYRQIREPYFFSYVRDRLIQVYGAETVRSGGLSVYTTIIPRYQRHAQSAIRETLTEPTDPAAALVSISPATGAIRAMTAVIPGQRRNEFNLLSQARRQPGSTFKTFVLATAVERGINPSSTYYVSAPFTYRPVADGNCDDGSWWCVKTYDSSYSGVDLDRARDDSLRQRGVRPTDTRPRSGAGRGDGPADGRPLAARREGRVRAVAGPRLDRRLAARSRVRLCHARGGRRERRADGDPQGRARERQGGHPGGLGRSEAQARAERRNRRGRDGDPRGQHALRHGDACVLRPPRRGQDRDDGPPRRRLVRWVHLELQTTVWMGYARGEIPMENVHGISVAGGTFPAEIWRRFMERAVAWMPVREFPEPRQWPVWQTVPARAVRAWL